MGAPEDDPTVEIHYLPEPEPARGNSFQNPMRTGYWKMDFPIGAVAIDEHCCENSKGEERGKQTHWLPSSPALVSPNNVLQCKSEASDSSLQLSACRGKEQNREGRPLGPQGANRKQALQETNFCFQFSSVKIILQLNKCDKKEGQLRIFWEDEKYREKSRRLRLENIGCDLCLKSASYRCGWLCSLHRERGK